MKQIITKILKKLWQERSNILYTLISLAIIVIGFWAYKSCQGKFNKTEYVDSTGVHHVEYNSSDFSALKKQNKQLYDSLKQYKNQIDYLIQFNYNKGYNTGKVITKTTTKEVPVYIKDNSGNYVEYNEEAKTYEYKNEPNDTLQYNLKINSTREPNWYELNVKTHDKITIVNKDEGNNKNHLTINTDNKADVSDVTVFKKKEKKHIMNVISIGPGIFYGYDVKQHKTTYGIGITLSYNIFGKK